MSPATDFSGLLRAVFEASRSFMLVVDDERLCVEVNPAAAEFLQATREEIVGKRLDDLLTPDRKASIAAGWPVLLRTGTAKGLTRIARRDGGQAMTFCATANVTEGRHLVVFTHLVDNIDEAVDDPGDRVSPPLSDRESQIVRSLALGESGAEIAETLFLSPETVRTHVRNAMIKLGARTRAQLVVQAIRSGAVRL